MGPINSLPEGSAKVTKSASKANHLFAFTFLVSFDREPEKNAREIEVFQVHVPAFFGGVRVYATRTPPEIADTLRCKSTQSRAISSHLAVKRLKRDVGKPNPSLL